MRYERITHRMDWRWRFLMWRLRVRSNLELLWIVRFRLRSYRQIKALRREMEKDVTRQVFGL